MKRLLYFVSFLLSLPVCLLGQVSYPLFTSGIYEVTESCSPDVQKTIISNGTLATGTASNNVVEVDYKCQMTYRAKDMIHLRPGFHAGEFDDNGYFKTEFFNHDVKLVTPDASSMVNGIVNVPKWEKLEIAFRLPPIFESAIANFFAHYYDGATGNQVNPNTDLNPYASDSLKVRVVFTSPTGRKLYKSGFFMREAKWGSGPIGGMGVPVPGAADLEEDLNHPLANYNWRVRFAPDEVDLTVPWIMKIEVEAPPRTFFPQSYDMGNFAFLCIDPLPDNHGYLHVNANNNRYLRFDDGTDYFGIGMNLSDQRKGNRYPPEPAYQWYKTQREDYELILTTIEELSQNGGNEIRVAFHRGLFVPEWENLGVYDAFNTADICAGGGGWLTNLAGNRQMDCWMIDKLFEKCRDENVYVQLCLILMNLGHSFEQYGWGDNAYYRNYVYGNPAPGGIGGYDTKKYYISGDINVPVLWKNTGSMYYWKRYLRYFFARWGYSTNISWIETINEIDLTQHFNHKDPIDNPNQCSDNNNIEFLEEQASRDYIEKWHEELISYSKTILDNRGSNLSTDFNHLWSVSYANWYQLFGSDNDITNYFKLFSLPEIDVMDVHAYDYWYYPFDWDPVDPNNPLDYSAANKNINHQRFLNGSKLYRLFNKPFCIGEGSSFGRPIIVQSPNAGGSVNFSEITSIYQNYKIPFHNMIWSSALSGACSVAKTWQWQVVAWWENGMPKPIADGLLGNRTNLKGQGNSIHPAGSQQPFSLINSPLLDQFQPLRAFVDIANLPSLVDFHYLYDESNRFECAIGFRQSVGTTKMEGVGWAHHVEKWIDNSYYILKVAQPPVNVTIGTETKLLKLDENYMNCQSQSSLVNSGRHIPLVAYGSPPGMDEYHTWPGTPPLLPEVSINYNQGLHASFINFSSPYLACDYEHESIAFMANGASNRFAQDDKTNNTDTNTTPVLKVFPNPLKDVQMSYEVISTNEVDINGELLIIDLFGRIIKSIKWNGDLKGSMDLPLLSEGMYSIVLKTATWTISKRFVKLQ
ncbi:MAG: T9SS type A sorting domain-containing protein [Bacteroidia bacterium]